MNDFYCEFCRQPKDTLYEGWFRQPQHEFNKGTASAGLIQLRIVCRPCLELAISEGMACAKMVPHENY